MSPSGAFSLGAPLAFGCVASLHSYNVLWGLATFRILKVITLSDCLLPCTNLVAFFLQIPSL